MSTPLQRPRPTPGWTVAVLATLGMSVSYVDRQTLAAIAPSVRTALAIDHTQFGWLVSAFSMAYLVGAPAAGVLVDRVGARRGFAIAVVVWSVVAGAHAFATSFASLFALRVLLGAAEAPSFPSAVQAIRRALPGARRPAAYGLLFTGSSLGAMVAAPLAVGLESRYGYRAAFALIAVVGTAWIPAWLFATRGQTAAPDERTHVPRERWVTVAFGAPVLRAVVAVVGSAPLVMFVLNWGSQYLVEAWHVPKGSVGPYLVFPPLLFDVGAVGFGALLARAGTDGKRRAGWFVVASLLATAIALAPLAPSPTIATLLLATAACGGGGIYVAVTNDMMSRIDPARTSAAGGMTAAGQSLAHVVASPLVGKMIDRTHGYDAVLVGLGILVVPTTLAFLAWPNVPGVREPT